MPHIYREVMKLKKQVKVGDMECVTLINPSHKAQPSPPSSTANGQQKALETTLVFISGRYRMGFTS